MQLRFFCFLVFFFLLLPIKALACDCKQIQKQKYCLNPDCITLCNLTELFSEEYSANAQMCLALSASNLRYTFDENNMGVLGLGSFIKNTRGVLQNIEDRDRKTLKEAKQRGECTNCELVPELSIELDTVPQGTPCPDKYLKEHHFKRTETFPQSENCYHKINTFFKDYVAIVLNVPFAGIKYKNRKKMKEEQEKSKELYKMCPNKCSFQTFQTLRVNHTLCTGSMDLTVQCTHKRSSNNIFIDYKRGVQCKE